ncbi:MAG: hypothetical protein ACLPPV_24920 [Candidatus Korobacteraceae bacterium]
MRTGDIDKLVIAFLNGNRSFSSTRRMRRLVQGVQQLFALGKSEWTETGIDLHPEAPDKREFLKAAQQVNKELARYRTAFSFETELGRGGNVLLGHFLRRSVGRGISAQEVAALERVLDVANNGKIDYFKMCGACGIWFYKRFSHQRYCSDACRMRDYQGSNRWKAYRRDKAREYYWLHKREKERKRVRTNRKGR